MKNINKNLKPVGYGWTVEFGFVTMQPAVAVAVEAEARNWLPYIVACTTLPTYLLS
jgi:hypothetical protein